MTNHAPTFTSSGATGSFSEYSNTTGSTSAHALSGTMAFKDSDRSDSHTTSASLYSAVWSGGSNIPTVSLNDLNAALSSSILSDSNGSGTLKWSFSAADRDFDFLAKNETLVLTYKVKVADNHGGSVTQTVKITITGTDDTPVISTSIGATFHEQTNQTLSLAPDTAHIAIGFTDPDLDNTGHTATVTGASATGATAGLLPGALGTAELMSFFQINNVVKASGSSSGTINTTFSAPDLAFDYLAAGQSINITYTVKLDDRAGGISTQNVVVTVIGTNDKPAFVCGPDSAHLVEGEHVSPSGDLTAHGDLLFGDIDLSDTHVVSETVTATRSGGGSVPLSNAALLAAMHLTLDDSTGTLLGDVEWNFALSNSSVGFLAAGETLTLTYNITVKDPSNATATQTVTITILGTNHPVEITSGPESASLSEMADTTGSAAPDTTTPVPTGTIAFTDQDLSDTHTVQVTVASSTWSGDPSVPAATLAALPSALQTTLHDSTGTGTGGVDWTFSIPDNNLDFLAAGETLTVNYQVKVSDGPTNATQTVTVTVDGANDAPVVTGAPGSASVSEQPNMTGSSTPDATSPVPTGTLTFTDVDLTDTHQVIVTIESATWSVDPFGVPFQTLIDLQTALMITLHDSNGTGSGSVDWSFSIPDSDLDFLGAGETLTVVYDVAVMDNFTSSFQTVTITATGAQDPLTVNPVVADFDTVAQDAGQVVLSGNLIIDAGDTGGDQSTVLGVTDVNGNAVFDDAYTAIAGAYGTLLVTGPGVYLYIADPALDLLGVGQNPTEVFNFTVTDSLNRSVTTTLTLNVTGGNDAPAITSADTTGSMTEDLGPTVLGNGGFETGDLTDWAASPAVEVRFLGLGGEFGDYTVHLGTSSGTISQNVATTPGEHYTVSFYVSGDPESTGNAFNVMWDGALVLALGTNYSGGLTRYSFDAVGDTSLPTTTLQFTYGSDGTGLLLDQVKVEPTTGPATETADGSISFTDETTDTHTASYVPQSGGYVGTFSLDPVSESGGSGSVAWHFTVNNSDIQFLAQDQTLNQVYTVSVTDDHGATTMQDVTISITGTNDAPTAVNDTVITDVGANGIVDIPAWMLAVNDTDPDTTDTLTPDNIVSSSGGTAVPFIDAFFQDDATPGGSFTYTVSDGRLTSTNAATVTIVNNAATSTSLTGTSGGDILIGNNGAGETLDGGGGNDALIGYGGGYIMTGGAGDDIFGFQSPSDATSAITDFDNIGSHDHVAISAFGFGLSVGMDVAPVFESSDDDQFISSSSLFHYDNANQTLYYSPDGTTDSAVALATFQAGVLLHANDLMVV